MLELAVLGVTLFLAAGAAGAQLHRRTAATRAMSQYATSRRYLFVPPPAGAPNASPRVEGERADVIFAIDLYRLGEQVRTRVATTVKSGRAARVEVVQRGGFARTFGVRRTGGAPIGHDAFDRAYRATCATSEDAEVLRDVAAGPLLQLDTRTDVWLLSDGGRVAISWEGVESDPLLLDAARDAVVALAGRHRPDSPYR